jgi:hypothetical protein
MAPGAEFKGQQQEKSRQWRIRQDRLGERRHPGFAVVKIAAKGMPAGCLQGRLRAVKQLLMLHFLFAKAQQRPQMGAVGVPSLLDDAGEVERDEFLIIAIQMRIAEGATITSPELSPTRKCTARPCVCRTSSLYWRSAACMASAA